MVTFYEFIKSIFGTYQPITILDSSNEIVDTCVDFGYIASVLLICLVIYFILKTIGGILYEWLR